MSKLTQLFFKKMTMLPLLREIWSILSVCADSEGIKLMKCGLATLCYSVTCRFISTCLFLLYEPQSCPDLTASCQLELRSLSLHHSFWHSELLQYPFKEPFLYMWSIRDVFECILKLYLVYLQLYCIFISYKKGKGFGKVVKPLLYCTLLNPTLWEGWKYPNY